MNNQDSKIFNALQQADWQSLIKEMIAFGLWRVHNAYYWRQTGDLPAGKEVQDLAMDVIEKTLSGERKWDPDLGPLKPWLMDQMKSEIDNLYNKLSSQQESVLAIKDESMEVDINSLDIVFSGSKNISQNPEKFIDKSERLQAMTNAFYKAIEGDADLEIIYYAIVDGCERKPRLLAAELNKPIKEINNQLKRFNRRVLAHEKQIRGRHDDE